MKVEAYDVIENLSLMYEIVGEEKFLEIIRMYGGNNLYITAEKNGFFEEEGLVVEPAKLTAGP